ncbi:hypothetical protein BKA67DRAFT_663721 [Truncatella angustata]|uniref:Autophagy-related protein 29 n=1 Tax=Truncatella angustata TaxID=152316 RepID=A0A9P8RK96_9PEZI|nr:uncharacterized protein BKA67DRAFT_663721 [Truncatella angustata]KAH6645838.1 hypothetical protein BKA67DRAFT_663721 [Truncatella angustata]
MAVSDPTYTVFIRLPFPRGDFVDPPAANWDSSKDEALWNIVSEVSKTDIDWNEIATRFRVTVDFLLQQVNFLTERHTSQVRAQLRRAAAAAKGPSAPSSVPGPEIATSGEGIQRTGSAASRTRAPSSLSIRKDSPLPRADGSGPGTPRRATPRPQATRKLSSNAGSVFATRNLGGSSKGNVRSGETQRRRLSSLPIATAADEVEPHPPSPGPADTSSAASSSDESSPAQSRIIRRPPRFQANDGIPSYADDDEDDEPAFMPYKPQNEGTSSGQHDLSATLRGNLPRKLPKQHGKIHLSQTSDSSASSAAPVSRGHSGGKGVPGGPLSPRRTMELAGRSPIGKGKGYSRDSDDASVTQSALEEALASRMQDGGIGSRMSTIGNVFRSRYLPKSNNQ